MYVVITTFYKRKQNKMKNILFRNMTPSEIEDACRAMSATEKTFAKNEIILHAGTITPNLGILLSGSVTIESTDFSGNLTILSHAGENDFFAETYAYLGEELLVDVRANEDCRILFLNVSVLHAESAVQKTSASWQMKFTRNLLSVSMRKNLILSGRIFHTSARTIRGKLLSYLNAVSLRTHSSEFDIPFDRQQLADYLNTDRTALSKELSRMQADGILTYRKNHFHLL